MMEKKGKKERKKKIRRKITSRSDGFFSSFFLLVKIKKFLIHPSPQNRLINPPLQWQYLSFQIANSFLESIKSSSPFSSYRILRREMGQQFVLRFSRKFSKFWKRIIKITFWLGNSILKSFRLWKTFFFPMLEFE